MPITPTDTALLNTVYAAQITLKSVVDGTSTKTLYIASRPIHGGNESYKPLLDSFSGLGMVVGQNGLPVKTSGSVTVIDEYESFGEELRLSDYFQNWTPIEQTIDVGYCLYGVGSTTFSLTSFYKGRIKSFSKSDSSLSLAVEPLGIQEKVLGNIPNFLTSTATKDITMTNPLNTGGRLPLLFGSSVEVPGINLGEGTKTGETFSRSIIAYGCRPSYATTASSITTYAKDENGNYRAVITCGNNIPSGGMVLGAAFAFTYSTPQGMTEKAYWLNSSSTFKNAVLANGRWMFKGQNAVITPTGDLYFSLYEVDGVDANARLGKLVDRVTVPKSNYLTAVRGVSNFWVDFVFNNPIVLKSDGNAPSVGGHAISLSLSTYATSTTDFVDGSDTGTTAKTWTRTNNGEWSIPATSSAAFVQLYGFQQTQFLPTYGTDVELLLDNAFERTVANKNNPLNKIEYVIRSPGIIDNSSGTYSGTANAALVYPHHVIKYLVSDDLSNWDFTTYAADYSAIFSASSSVNRKISGYIEGGTTLEGALSEICRQNLCKIIQLNNGKLSLWAWGKSGAAAAKVFTDEDLTIKSYDCLDSSSVINKFTFNYDRRFVNFSAQKAAEGSAGYTIGIIDSDTSKLGTVSKSIYGNRNLENDEFQLIGDSATAGVVTDYYLRHFDHPHKTISFTAPLADNFPLELMNVVEILSTALPAEGGTVQSARMPTYNGTDVDLLQGEYWKRAQRYRGYIVGKDYSWSKGTEATVSLTVWLTSPCHPNAIT